MAAAVQLDPPHVRLAGQGELKGKNIDGVARFLGIPFAAPPVGPLRWRPPQPPLPWDGVRCDPKKLPRCPQPGPKHRTFKTHLLSETEDCLVLNVWTPRSALPALAPAEDGGQSSVTHASTPDAVPVIVFIHGGNGKFGCAHSPGESGLELAKSHHVCYISINYRLGAFGFLAHPSLSAEDEEGPAHSRLAGSGNFAILDMISALEWVQRHAAAFGGNPGNVTIWGLSSGAQFVSTLLVSPLAEGLFHKAMIQSCSDLNAVRKLRSSCDIWLGKSAEDWGEELGVAMGCAKGATQLAEMRSLTAKTIVELTMDDAANDCYCPPIDRRNGLHVAKPLSSLEALANGKFHRVPVILGYTAKDGLGKCELEQTMFDVSDVQSMQGVESLMEREFGCKKAEALSLYGGQIHPAKNSSSHRSLVDGILGKLATDLWYYAGTWHMADLLASAADPPPVFVYVFNGLRPSLHGDDRTFWRGMEPLAVASVMAEHLTHFARDGNPNGDGSARWENHNPGSRRYMELGSEQRMVEVDRATQVRYEFVISEYFGKRFMCELAKGEELAVDMQTGCKRSAMELSQRFAKQARSSSSFSN